MALNIGKIIKATGRGITAASSSKAGLGAVAVGAFGLGFANTVAPAVRDAAFDFALGDPNADVAFTGRKINTRYLVGEGMSGPLGTATRLTSPMDYETFSSPVPTGKQALISAGVGGTLGATSGGIIGKFAGTVFNKKLGVLGTAIGGAIGAVAGGSAGLVGARNMVKNNQRFYQESPYNNRNTSLNTMNSTNAVGDIVLGMHNARRGY